MATDYKLVEFTFPRGWSVVAESARSAARSKTLKRKRTAPTLRYCGKENVELAP